MSIKRAAPKPIEVIIRVEDGKLVHLPSFDVKVGQKVRFSSPDGKLMVKFGKLSPLSDGVGKPLLKVSDARLRLLRQDGTFHFQCFVTPSDGKTYSYRDGGDLHVGK